MSSQRQIEANRRNAKLSTGPKTPEGKAKAARNHSLHGLRSRDIVIPGEDPREFAALLAALQAEFRPANPLDHALVRQLASAQWRLHRVLRAETALLSSAYKDQPDTAAKWGTDAFDKLVRYEASAQNAFFKALHALHSRRVYP